MGAVILALAACGEDRDEPARASSDLTPLDEAVVWEREFTLEENEETINVVVRATVDSAGGFLIADEREGFVRRYSLEGRLLAQFGGKGHGPSEFRAVLTAMRLPDGSIAAFDGSRKGAVFDSSGTALVRTFLTPLDRLHSAVLLNDTLALLGGQIRSQADDFRLHLWNLHRDSLVTSFFAPSLPSTPHKIAASVAGWVDIAQRGDTLAVVTSLSDTLYLLALSGEVLERIPIPFRGFRHIDPEMELPTGSGSIGEARHWMGSFSMISHVHWLGDRFVIQYQDRVRPQPDWRILGMSRGGEWLFEVLDTPKLVTSEPDRGLLYFISPESETPNVWRSARLRDE